MNGLCHAGNWGSFGNLSVSGWIGWILTLVFWVGLIAGLTLLVVRSLRRARVQATTVPFATQQPFAKEILQTKYARGEITREQYELGKQELI